ncbi:MAG: phosphoenolpyruvate--protein phosphotransferase [Pyrinomonadaceae bacterium]
MSSRSSDSGRRIAAIAISRGIAFGNVVFLAAHESASVHERIDIDRVADEVTRFEKALQTSTRELRDVAAENDFDPETPAAAIFAVHLSIIEDSSFVQRVASAIQDQMVNAEWAVSSVADHLRERQIAVMDDRFRETHLDIDDVAHRIIAALRNSVIANFEMCRGAIVAAAELRPSQVVAIARFAPAAFVTEHGGWTSHSSIIARELRIPMVSGVKDIHTAFSESDRVEVNGYEGTVVVNPSREQVAKMREGTDSHVPGISRATEAQIQTETKTTDGVLIIVRANADSVGRFQSARVAGAAGIGLFRSESVIGDGTELPAEDEQVAAYTAIADAAGRDGVRIRTFDIGPGHFDKTVERNAALGLRAIRLSLAERSSFRIQIRALLRASADREIDLILPMVSGLREIEAAKSVIDDEFDRLADKGVPIRRPKLGAMIEVPSAVITIDQILRRVDFICLGTNDLVQYLLAVDRDNEAAADWYQSLHPAVIRALRTVLTAAAAAGKPAIVCGEMAGSPFYVPVLLGLGARELSINVNSVAQITGLIRSLDMSNCEELVAEIEAFTTAGDTEAFLRSSYATGWPSIVTTELLPGN